MRGRHTLSHSHTHTHSRPPSCIRLARRYQISLFAHISNISWSLDREDRVAGTVSNAQSGDLRPFDLAASTMDEHTLVNELWKLI